jgi:predicted CxxxxCH...CXXCH cytochrome family protein
MAQERRKKKPGFKTSSDCLMKAARRAVLQVNLVYFISAISLASQIDANNQAPIEIACQSDMSLPLWGGGEEPLNGFVQEVLPAGGINLHHFEQVPCGSCHETPAVSDDYQDGWKNGVDVNRSCTSMGCHEYDEKMNHPLNVPMPAGISKDQSTVMTCLSCHLPQDPNGMNTQNGQTDHVLQDPGIVGCESCHERLSGSIRQRSHWKFSRKAHLVSLVRGSLVDKTSDAFMASGIDMESSTCLSCHDKVTVTIPAMNETRQQKTQRFKSMTDHPIGMNYQYILSQNPMYFNSLMGQQGRIRMFDGQVGCGSCHSLYSDIPSNLTAEYKGSVLCRTCHNR